MNFMGGIILLAVGIAMVFFGRARGGEELPIFRRVWIIGQAYVMTAMTIGVMGVSAIIANWPL